MGGGVSQHLKGPGEQRVTGQDRRRLIEGDVTGWLATPQFVVVHGGKVVVHQGIAVHHLDRRRRPEGAGLGNVEQSRAAQHHERADALAPAKGAIAHSVHQPRFGPTVL